MNTTLEKDIVDLIFEHPFWGALLIACNRKVELSDRQDAFAAASANPTPTIHIYKKYFEQSKTQRLEILKHELLHLLLKHCFKEDVILPIWNIAADVAINQMLNLEFGLLPEHFQLPPNLTAEEYYKLLLKDSPCLQCPKKQGQQGQGQGQGQDQEQGQGQQSQQGQGQGQQSQQGQGQGKGQGQNQQNQSQCPLEKECFWDIIISDGEMERVMGEAQVDKIWESVRKQGFSPGNIEGLFVPRKRKPLVNWKKVVKQFAFGGDVNILSFTKKRYSKRYGTPPAPLLKEQPSVIVAVDSSGSITDPELEAFLAEALQLTKLCNVHLVVCDAELHEIYNPLTKKIAKGVKISGRGGTDFRPVFEYAEKIKRKAPFSGVIFLTDGYGTFPEKTSIRTLWILTKDSNVKVPFGKSIQLPENIK
jgi:predicted metal-dependent peptidase